MILINGNAQKQDLKTLKQQFQVVKLTADWVAKKIDLEKERQNNVKVSGKIS